MGLLIDELSEHHGYLASLGGGGVVVWPKHSDEDSYVIGVAAWDMHSKELQEKLVSLALNDLMHPCLHKLEDWNLPMRRCGRCGADWADVRDDRERRKALLR